jgi:hypothetical protein
MTTPCPRCNDTGEQRYWEGRWRDEKAENERLQKLLLDACVVFDHYDLPEHSVHYRREIVGLEAAKQIGRARAFGELTHGGKE